MEAKYDLCVCGHIRDHHQYYLTGGETAHSCKTCVCPEFRKQKTAKLWWFIRSS